jgi:hypothetical protein
MALLASPDVGVRRRALLSTVRLVSEWPDFRAKRINLTHGRRIAELRARFHGGSELTFVTTVVNTLTPFPHFHFLIGFHIVEDIQRLIEEEHERPRPCSG